MKKSDFGKDQINFEENVGQAAENGYYQGQFLIATPSMMGEMFTQSLIYIFAHNAGGAMGLVLNKPLDMLHYATLFQQLGIDINENTNALTVYHGGPVEENRGFVIHSNDYRAEDTIEHECGLSVTASMAVLRDLAHGAGPAQAMLAVGYAGWAAGQLESEIESNYWLSVPASPAIAFHPDEESKHALAAKTLGIDMMRFSPVAGHA